uniref:Uncharacterized protein n=1 Tax=Aegilops tauschii subsp. strangulata TaxID=200361 RepID=A0A453CF43_AEGTS
SPPNLSSPTRRSRRRRRGGDDVGSCPWRGRADAMRARRPATDPNQIHGATGGGAMAELCRGWRRNHGVVCEVGVWGGGSGRAPPPSATAAVPANPHGRIPIPAPLPRLSSRSDAFSHPPPLPFYAISLR